MSDGAERIREQCELWLTEASDLRTAAVKVLPAPRAGAEAVDRALALAGGYAARVEAIYVRALALRSAARRRAADLADAASEAWDRRSVELRRTAVGDRFQSGRQHEADVNLAIFAELRESRQAARLRELTEDVARQIEIIYRGLEADRRDLNARLRHTQWVMSMER